MDRAARRRAASRENTAYTVGGGEGRECIACPDCMPARHWLVAVARDIRATALPCDFCGEAI